MKKIISMLVSLAIIAGTFPMMIAFADGETSTAWDGTVATGYAGGTGTVADPYLISNGAELAYLAEQVNSGENSGMSGKYFKLTADIDLGNNKPWTPIGCGGDASGDAAHRSATSKYNFKGNFNGDGHVVRNMKISSVKPSTATDYVDGKGSDRKRTFAGLFGYIEAGTVKNLRIEDATIDGEFSRGNLGGLTGRTGGGTIENCYVKNITIKNTAGDRTNAMAGGMIGSARGSTTTVENCYVYGASFTVASTPLGGLVGHVEEWGESLEKTPHFINCYTSNISVGAGNLYPFGRYNTRDKEGFENIEVLVTNCYTDVDGTASDWLAKDILRGDNAAVKSTKKQIKDGLATVTGYSIDKTVNSGYPCFTIETGWDGTVATGYAGGTGTEADPYLISNAAELAYLAEQVNGGTNMLKTYFKLTADIDLGNKPWTPIGCTGGDSVETYNFKGSFDGNGHVIKNMKITDVAASTEKKTRTFVGLFGHISGGTIKNLGIEDVTINGEFPKGNLGGLIGRLSGGTVSDCYVKNIVINNTSTNTTEAVIGGMIGSGRSAKAYVNNCYVYGATLSAPKSGYFLGGMVGRLEEFGENVAGNVLQRVNFTNCYSTNISAGTGNKGKLYPFGYLGYKEYFEDEWNRIIKNCYATDTITASASDWATRDILRGMSTEKEVANRVAVKSTKAQIVAALGSVAGVYKVDSHINDGYPALAREKVIKPYVINSVTPGTAVTVSLTENEYAVGSTLYVATYDGNDRLMDVVVLDPEDGNNATTLSSVGASYVKAFVWNNSQTPLAAAYKVDAE